MKISVKVKTGAREEKIENLGENNFFVSVRQRPEKGLANKSVIKVVAKYFKLTPTMIKIVSGHSSKQKIIEI